MAVLLDSIQFAAVLCSPGFVKATPLQQQDDGLSTGTIIGIVLAAVVALLAILAAMITRGTRFNSHWSCRFKINS